MPERKRSRKPCACACTGCLSTALVCVLALVIEFFRSGSYQPYIPPPHLLPVPNAYDDYIAAARMIHASGGTEAIYGSKPGLARVPVVALEEVVVARNAPALARIRAALGKRCRAPQVRSFLQSTPEVGAFREMSRLLRAEADVRAARGDYAGAASSGVDLLQASLDIVRGGGIAQATAGYRAECEAQAIQAHCIEHLQPADALRLAARLEGILRAREPFIDILWNERTTVMASLLQVDTWPGGLDGDSTSSRLTERFRIGNMRGRLWWQANREQVFREMDTYLRAIEEQAAKPAWARRDVPDPRSPVASMIAPPSSRDATRYDILDARSRMVVVMLLVRSYAVRHQHLPSTLAQLGQDRRWTTDPLTGRDLVYTPRGTSYLLYSIGPDLKDDGGLPANEAIQPVVGDLGASAFRYDPSAHSPDAQTYRRVPHMLPPKLPPGAPPLSP